MRNTSSVKYKFDRFCLDSRDRQLARNDEILHLEPKAFDVLQYLVENNGHLVTKQELVDAVWAPAIVSDNSLTRCIHQVRLALEDSADKPRFIETVPGSGYRFITPVDVLQDPGPSNDMRAASRRIGSLPILIVIVVALGAGLFIAWQLRAPDVPTVERIAVLPLVNLTGAPKQEYFVQGVHEALIAELSRVAPIDVISRTSVMGFANTDLSVPEIADQLDVDAIIEGSVLRAGENLTVTAQLIATNPERHLWAERYHRDVSDVFEITTDIVSAIASEIAIELSSAASPDTSEPMELNNEAYEAYLLGRFHFEQRSPEGYRLAREHFQRAIEFDPSFALPYVGLAHTFGSAAIFGVMKPADGFPRARQLAEKAVALDSTLAEAHLILAGVQFYWDWNWEEAEQRANLALGLNANLANAYRFLAEVYSVTGRYEEALAAVERGRAIDPLPPTSQFKPSLILYLSRDFEEAIARSQSALEYYPGFWQGHWLLCISLAASNRLDGAVTSCEKAVELSGGMPMAVGALGYALALAGHRDEATKLARDLESQATSGYVGPASIAVIYGALGRTNEAFQHLLQAYEVRDQQLIHAEHAAFFDPMRADARFLKLRREYRRLFARHKEKISAK